MCNGRFYSNHRRVWRQKNQKCKKRRTTGQTQPFYVLGHLGSIWVSLDFQTRRVPPFSFSLVKLWLLFTWAKSTPTQAVAIPLLTSHLNYTTPFIFFSYHTSPHSLATFFFISHICLTPLPITNYAFIPSLILWLSFFFCPLQKSIQTARGLTLAFLSTATSDFTVCWHQCKDFFLFFFCVFL